MERIIIVGSWCVYFYKNVYFDGKELMALRTNDVDVLLPKPLRVSPKIDLSKMLLEMGYQYIGARSGYGEKYAKAELEIEFLTHQAGAGRPKSNRFSDISINAQGLDFMNLLQANTINLTYKGKTIVLPKIEAFILQKMLVLKERSAEKREKDIRILQSLIDFVKTVPDLVGSFIALYNDFSKGWKTKVIKNAKNYVPELLELLNQPKGNN
ncbi:MAG: hypothetical protein A2509_09775 [Candidatus Edwardsbacteria bacterium RIFOXYD12_FULL_50_11]|uniref:Nucleotidyltransferase-like domain-containing protein n=1 Tax=Candidatus Edwardsbacteria bacterium GWF2_54_11 TaxID=1817851 RepID=A0A1F5RC30_9BACT|nr:MAG: hypothetical protein A2502_08095 [Candidatus Edwardsbacteria bacterium RifOxyC12_full_54_24]OGF07445.1 MAG: hypothetical protein A2273_02960 [Candidatus Edwardsbacteria bacterium RifOxyA12_full_54_48]OGF09695.1 MAG: hypothetical protein A3K15_09370 [Candidatus Edwardsbacteria bacterium GWE2_54_12]OGF11958.1 MAG: hypothetical protein A2024_02925 [Candidatus Edwardsbacteria bacterium GWF2_54_11]OGF18140.1 MAG: hypothetical protein A2509_09775 [Candidatus Edwardsbacteria bacterium RIFOXYD1